MEKRNCDFQRGQINQLKHEKLILKDMVARRNREINAHIKNLEEWIEKYDLASEEPKEGEG